MKLNEYPRPMTPDAIKSQQAAFDKERGTGDMYRQVTADGEGIMVFATYKALPCGCRVIGNGTLPFPFTVLQCDKHAATL